MIYININNWRKPIFRFIKSKKVILEKTKTKTKRKGYLLKFSEFCKEEEIIEPATKIVYEIVNNELISKIETRQNNISYTDYVAETLYKNSNKDRGINGLMGDFTNTQSLYE